MIKNAQFYTRIKYINITYYFIREKVNNNIINIRFIFINKQIANELIKTLYLNKFIIFRDALEIKAVSKYSKKFRN